MNIKPFPGIIVIEPLKEEKTVQISEDTNSSRHILKGIVVAVGEPFYLNSGAKIDTFVKVGDVVRFMSYDGGYDVVDEDDNKTYYTVKFEELRYKVE